LREEGYVREMIEKVGARLCEKRCTKADRKRALKKRTLKETLKSRSRRIKSL